MRSRIFLGLAAALAYSSALLSGFVWDDHHTLERGRLIGSLANLPQLFWHDTMFNADGGAFAKVARVDTYRPLTMTTFFIERALFGLRAWAFHLDSILIHVLAVLVLFAVGKRLCNERAALWGALIFAVHPAVSEAVHWVNGRSDPLCVLFFLTAMWAWLDGRAIVAALAILAATLCKETTFALLPPLLLLERKRVWPLFAGAALGFLVRLLALGRPAASAGGTHVVFAITRLPLVWLDGVVSLLVPAAKAPPSLYERYQHPSAAWMALAILVSASLVALAIWRRGLWRWAIASFLCALAPVALLTYDEGWYGWGRYLYPALPPVALAIGRVIGPLLAARPLARGSAILIVALMAVSTFLAARDWHDDRSFAQAMIDDHPDSSMGWSELAVVELRENHPVEALGDAEHAIERAPKNFRHWSRAATALMKLDRRPEAYQAAARALALQPDDANARYVTAIRWLGERRGDEAATNLLEAIRLEPDQEGPWNTLAQARAQLPEVAHAVDAAASDPRYAAIAPRLRALSH